MVLTTPFAVMPIQTTLDGVNGPSLGSNRCAHINLGTNPFLTNGPDKDAKQLLPRGYSAIVLVYNDFSVSIAFDSKTEIDNVPCQSAFLPCSCQIACRIWSLLQSPALLPTLLFYLCIKCLVSIQTETTSIINESVLLLILCGMKI